MTRDESLRFIKGAVLIGVGAALVKIPLDLAARPRAPLSALTDPSGMKNLSIWACGLILLQALVDVAAAIAFCVTAARRLGRESGLLAFGGALTAVAAELLKWLVSFAFDTFVVVSYLSQAGADAPIRPLVLGSILISGPVSALFSLVGGIVLGGLTGGLIALGRPGADRAS